MKKIILPLLTSVLLTAMAACSKVEGDVRFTDLPDEPLQPWSLEKARDWYAAQPWIVGCNFFPSTAINQIEMWQSSTYDHETIDRELGWAADLGFNTVRVFLHSAVWEYEHDAFFRNIDDFLTLTDKHGIKVMFCFFSGAGDRVDRCQIGKQLDPVAGIHNLDFKGDPAVIDENEKAIPERFDLMRMYVEEVVARYREDDRILIWEAWDEPGTASTREDSVSELLPKTIQWIRGQQPVQPITVGIHSPDRDHAAFGEIALSMSDINSYHSYSPWEDLYTDTGTQLVGMKNFAMAILAYGRPVICSEYLARGGAYKGTFENTLPFMKQYRIGAINWGLVWGKTNTIWPWGSVAGDPEPEYWFHDILYPDGTPRYPEEVEFLHKIIGVTDNGEQ